MADDVDRANTESDVLGSATITQIQKLANSMPAGVDGVCKNCGDYFARIVREHCGRCRDLLKLP